MDGSTVRGNLKEQIFGIGTSCIHGRFVQGEIWCKILRIKNSIVPGVDLSTISQVLVDPNKFKTNGWGVF